VFASSVCAQLATRSCLYCGRAGSITRLSASPVPLTTGSRTRFGGVADPRRFLTIRRIDGGGSSLTVINDDNVDEQGVSSGMVEECVLLLLLLLLLWVVVTTVAAALAALVLAALTAAEEQATEYDKRRNG
jgi:hypothetical protein